MMFVPHRDQSEIAMVKDHLEVEWRDGSTLWIALKSLKESNAMEVVEYAVTNQINTEPTFNWWVHVVSK